MAKMNRSIHSEVVDLTDRQIEILALVSKGCSNVDIAQLLNISPNTVKAHMATMFERLHVSNRTEASVLYEKHLHNEHSCEQNKRDLIPFISISLIYKGLSRTEEIAENLSQLLHCFEIITVQSQASQNVIKDSKSIAQPFLLKIDDLTDVNADIQIALFSNDGLSERQELLYKTNHPLAIFDSSNLIKYAVEIYHQILKAEVEKAGEKRSNQQQLCAALLHCEAVNFEQLALAKQLSEHLLKSNESWHLLHAMKSMIANKMITNGYSNDVAKDTSQLAYHARKALSLKPTSSWSQLAFAYFCALSSDLKLAKKHLLASVEANPCQHRALQLLGQIFAFEGSIQKSIELFNQLLVNFPNSESKGICHGALALVYYCAEDYLSSKKSAQRALMYEDAPKVPMLITLISIAEIEQDDDALFALKQQASTIDDKAIQSSLLVAQKIVPPERMNNYLSSLKRTGVI